MRLEIIHTTRYRYDRPVQLLPHLFYLRPCSDPWLTVQHFSLVTEPLTTLQWLRDDFDNQMASAQFAGSAQDLAVMVEAVVATSQVSPFGFLVRDYAATFPFAYEALHRSNLAPYLELPAEGVRRQLERWLETGLRYPPRDTVGWIFALNQLVNRSFAYRPRDEPGIQSPQDTLAGGTGSCRDFAVFLIACLRTRGLAARFVSGYNYDAASAVGQSVAMHAWVEVFLPGAGWKGLDPTHGIFCAETYVPVAHAAVAESVNPIQGAFFSALPASSQLSTSVHMRCLA